MAEPYQNYIVETTYSGEDLLEDWRWLAGDDFRLLFVTKFGDAFLTRGTDGAVVWLSVTAGTIEPTAPTINDLEAATSDQTNYDDWFIPFVIRGLEALGMTLGPNQCYTLRVPPVLGGRLDPDNIEVCDIAVHFSINGQLHEQVKDLPPGTRIDRIKLVGPTRDKKPW